MIASTFLVLSASEIKTANAQTTTIPSNLLQYEWTQPRASNNGSNFNSGPGPNSPSVQWRAKIAGTEGLNRYNGSTQIGIPVAFNGMLFVPLGGKTYALNAATGNIVWTAPFFGTAAKIDDTYMVIGSRGVKIADGSTVWTGPAGFSYGASTFSGAGYVPELKMFVDQVYGWNIPDPSKAPTLAWNLTNQADVGTGACVYGAGKVFIGGNDYSLRAYDAKTGTFLWETADTSTFIYGMSYADGKIFHGGLDNNLRCFDANTGKILWTYNPHTYYGQWASSTGYAYGMVYEHNQDNYMYAINATTGKLVWRQSGPGIYYSNTFNIADGKIYVMMGENEYRDFATGDFGYSEFDCFNAYTGNLIWTMPLEDGAPMGYQCVAYGNLYVVPTVSYSTPGVVYSGSTIGEVWCIGGQAADWSMFLGDSARSAQGSGPTNLQFKWNFTTGGIIVSSATCANGVAYFGSFDKKIYAIDAATGAQKWTFTTGYKVYSTPAVINGKVYTGADDGNVYCLDANTGSQVWKTPAGGITTSLLGLGYTTIRSSPAVLNGRVYVGSLDGNLYCFDASSGSVVWKFQGVAPSAIFASPTISGDAIYLSSARGGYRVGFGPAVTNGDFYKLDLNGNVIWHNEIPYLLNLTSSQGNFLFATPTVAPDLGMVFLRNGYWKNYAFNATTGATIWTYSGMYNPGTLVQLGGAPQVDTLTYAYGRLYFGDYYGVSCLNATSGSRIWYTYTSREINNPAITYSYGRVYAANEAGVLYVLDALSGSKLSYYETGNLQMHSAATPYNGNVYIGASDMNLYCFGDARIMSAKATTAQPSVAVASSANLPLGELAPAIVPAAQTPTTTTSSTTVTYVTAAAVIAIAAATAAIILKKRK
jgi:outer membrane protein assembly factor BamB